MSDREPDGSLDDLAARIAKARRDREGPAESAPSTASNSGAGYAMAARIGAELIAGIAVGVLIGWALDGWLGTRPWLMVAFLFLGAGAGMMNAYRALMGLGLAVGYRRPGAEGHHEGDRDDG
jgi:ATP synthase protein I